MVVEFVSRLLRSPRKDRSIAGSGVFPSAQMTIQIQRTALVSSDGEPCLPVAYPSCAECGHQGGTWQGGSRRLCAEVSASGQGDRESSGPAWWRPFYEVSVALKVTSFCREAEGFAEDSRERVRRRELQGIICEQFH